MMRKTMRSLILVAMAAGVLCAAALAGDLGAQYPKAAEGLKLLAKSPLLQEALAAPKFFDKLDSDPAFYNEIVTKLDKQAYRAFGPVPSVRVRIMRGAPTYAPAIMLEYQTKFDDIVAQQNGKFKKPTCVWIGGGRDNFPCRTLYGGNEDPKVRAEWDALLKQRASIKSNKRREFDPVINEFMRKVMPSMPLDQVRSGIEKQMKALAAAFAPYGGEVLKDSYLGQFGVKLSDQLYIVIRKVGADGSEGDSRIGANPYFWVMLGGAPRPQPKGYLPAFPGAEGFGAMTTGGRGGKTIYVTNLNPEGPGSLKEALLTTGTRTVLFKVSGQIMLPDETWITQPNLTLIGYNAPGEGVEICGRLMMAADNVIMRGVRWRLRPPQSADGMDTRGNLKNIIFDHCSFAYGSDEIIRFIGENSSFIGGTIQNCVVGPGTGGLGTHPYGPEVGGVVSFHHNILYNTFSRSPEVDCDLFDWRNNIMYNLRSGHSHRPANKLNYMFNMIVTNPSIKDKYGFNHYDNTYLEGNKMDDGGQVIDFESTRSDYLKAPYAVMPVTTDKPEELEAKLLPAIGASLPVRDATDAHWIDGLKKRTGKPAFWKDNPKPWKSYNRGSNELDNFEALNLADFPAPVKAGAEAAGDVDGDGMSNKWELKNRLNPKDPSDAAADPDKDGYTNLEECLNHTDPHQFVDYKNPKNNVDKVFQK